MRRTRLDPPTIEELQKDLARQQRLKQNVARLDQAYAEERAQLAAEAEKVAQLDAPRKKQAQSTQDAGSGETQKVPPYPSQGNPAIVPTSTAETGHPPSQEFGASIPKATPKENLFPGIAQESPERQQMAAALDDAANKTMGKDEKEKQLHSGVASPCEATVCNLREFLHSTSDSDYAILYSETRGTYSCTCRCTGNTSRYLQA